MGRKGQNVLEKYCFKRAETIVEFRVEILHENACLDVDAGHKLHKHKYHLLDFSDMT